MSEKALQTLYYSTFEFMIFILMSRVLPFHTWNLCPLLFWLLLLFFHSSILPLSLDNFNYSFIIIFFLVWKIIACSTRWIQTEICPFQGSVSLFKTLKGLFCINEVEDKQVMYFLVKEQKRDIRMLKRLIVALICRLYRILGNTENLTEYLWPFANSYNHK